MAARYMECTVNVKKHKHGDNVNSDVTTDMFISCSNYEYWECVHKKKTPNVSGTVHQCTTETFFSSSACSCFSLISETEMAES
jgi:hypothetical protein